MGSCKTMAIAFAVYFIAALMVSALPALAMNEVEDVAAIPPTPMESNAMPLSASGALAAAIAFLVWFL